MSEPAEDTTSDTQQGGNSSTSGETPAANEFKPITTPAELDAFLKDRVARAERKATEKFADYKDLKAKAAKLDEIEQANLSELEKANGRITTAETERDTAKAESLRLRIAVTHGISLDDADLFLTGTDEETLTAQAKRLSDRAAEQAKAESDRKMRQPIVPKEGTSTHTGATTEEDDRQFANAFFRGTS
jgi:hypothetical protein